MHSMRLAAGSTLLLAALVTTPAGAQSWTPVGTPDNSSGGSQFWDNPSGDGANCNAGFVVTGVAGTAGNYCANQRPVGWLPYLGAAPSVYLNGAGGLPQGFLFAPGWYTFDLLAGAQAGGDIAGMNADWGWFDSSRNRYSLNSLSGPTGYIMDGLWGFWIALGGGGYAYSDLDWQFALFGFSGTPGIAGGIITPDGPNNFIVGMEDKPFFREIDPSDRDFQDVMFKVTATPEPSTWALLATGLAALALVGYRNRRRDLST